MLRVPLCLLRLRPDDCGNRLFSQRDTDPLHTFDPRMVQRHGFASADHIFQGNKAAFPVMQGNHDAELFLPDGTGAGGTELGGQGSVKGRGGTAALQMAQNGKPGFQTRKLLQPS